MFLLLYLNLDINYTWLFFIYCSLGSGKMKGNDYILPILANLAPSHLIPAHRPTYPVHILTLLHCHGWTKERKEINKKNNNTVETPGL